MTFGEFLSGRLGSILLQLVCAAAAALFLLSTGAQPGVVALLLLVLAPVFGAVQLTGFLRQRARLRELEAILEGLDQKYLFAECVPPAGGPYERRLLELARRAGRAMVGAVSDAQAAQKEYREYIEQWVHEIKTPITAAKLICQNTNSDTRRKLSQELAQIDAHVERALFYARAENPEKDFIIGKTELSAICEGAIQTHKTLLIQSGIRIEAENLNEKVYTDGKWVAFMLGQLLQNAARYRGEAPVITLSSQRLGQQVRLSVQDNGIGIPACELPRVFDRGFTGGNGRKRGGSTGMGLYLCKRLADALEIGLQIQSTEGMGTCVALTFPAEANLTKT